MAFERLIIHAPNVHTGGSKALLVELLASLSPFGRGAAILDRRLELPLALPGEMPVQHVSPSLRERWMAEWNLAQLADERSHVLCFGNLPPLFSCRGRVTVFLHNRHLVSSTDLADFPLRTRLRLRGERLWVRLFASHVDEWIVQTESMRLLLEKALRAAAAIRVLPFVPAGMFECPPQSVEAPTGSAFEPVDFCYVASGEPHKNHRNLIGAWTQLSQEGLFPSLRLTLDSAENRRLCEWIERKKRQFGLRIDNVGRVGADQLAAVYRSSKCLIHPSWCESFGLPLIEARSLGLSIVASELDYVRDLVVPDETFDPHSARSIARAVRRHLGSREAAPSLGDGKSFLRQLAAA